MLLFSVGKSGCSSIVVTGLLLGRVAQLPCVDVGASVLTYVLLKLAPSLNQTGTERRLDVPVIARAHEFCPTASSPMLGPRGSQES